MSEGHVTLLLTSRLWFPVAFKMSPLGIRASRGICLILHSPARIPRTSSCSHSGPLSILQPCTLSHRHALLILLLHLCVTTCSSSVECVGSEGPGFPGAGRVVPSSAPRGALCEDLDTRHAALCCLFLCPSPSVACEPLGGRNLVLLISDPQRLAQCLAQSSPSVTARGVHGEGSLQEFRGGGQCGGPPSA